MVPVRDQACAGTLIAEAVQTLGRDRAAQVRAREALALEQLRPLEQAQEHVVHHLVRVRDAAEQALGTAKRRRRMLAIQLLARLLAELHSISPLDVPTMPRWLDRSARDSLLM